LVTKLGLVFKKQIGERFGRKKSKLLTDKPSVLVMYPIGGMGFQNIPLFASYLAVFAKTNLW